MHIIPPNSAEFKIHYLKKVSHSVILPVRIPFLPLVRVVCPSSCPQGSLYPGLHLDVKVSFAPKEWRYHCNLPPDSPHSSPRGPFWPHCCVSIAHTSIELHCASCGYIHAYIHTYIHNHAKRQLITITCLAFRLGNYLLQTMMSCHVTVDDV